MDRTNLEKLWPRMKIRNRLAHSQHLLYLNNDSITIAGGATRTVDSAGLLQIPSIRDWELLSPTLFELHNAGIITIGAVATPDATETPATQGTVSASDSAAAAATNSSKASTTSSNPADLAAAAAVGSKTAVPPTTETVGSSTR